jgi:TPR repeat protein
VRDLLPTSAVLLLLVGALLAQDPLPASTQTVLATQAHLEALTHSDLSRLVSEAESGDRKAEYLLALLYQEDRLVPRDLAAARKWMLKSAEQGYVPAQAGMGGMLISGRNDGVIPDYADADRWLRMAATQGDGDAQLWLGVGYERGWFGVTDYCEALKWLRKAAEQGQPTAQFSLGQMYEDGEGVPESDSLAASWYRKAADHSPAYLGGVWEAEVQLSYMYRDGRLPEDNVQAYMWFAVVGGDDDMKRVARHMTRGQILHAQRMVEDWIKQHTLQRPVDAASSPKPTP